MEISLDQFRRLFLNLKTIPSASGSAGYEILKVGYNEISLLRTNTGNDVTVYLKELFKVYQKLDRVNTSILRDYISDRVQSPAYALLLAARLYDIEGNRLQFPEILPAVEDATNVIEGDSTQSLNILQPKSNRVDNDEDRFFRLLADILGHEYLQSKSIGKPVDTDLVVLYADYRKFNFFISRIPSALQNLLNHLDSDLNFGDSNLATYIDCLIFDHPVAGSRIVEFDEEQHFTPPRYFTLLSFANSGSY